MLTIKLDAGELSKKILDSTLGRKYDDIKKGKLSEEVESTENEGAFVGKETRNVPQERKACSLCGKLGHLRENCWQDPKNAKAREDYLRRMGERSEMGDQKNGFAPFGGRAYLDTHYFRTPHRETRTCYRCGSRGHIARNCPLGNEIHLEEGNVGINSSENGEMTNKIAFVRREESGDKLAVGENVSDTSMSSEDDYFSDLGYDEEQEKNYHQVKLREYKVKNEETGLAVDSWTDRQHRVRYLKIVTLTGKEYGVTLKGSATVGDLKRENLNETGFPVSDQRLCFRVGYSRTTTVCYTKKD